MLKLHTRHLSLFKRTYTTAAPPIRKAPIAFAFDIDGVLMQSKRPITPAAPLTLAHLNQHNIPFILLTNGGGQTERARIDFLNNALQPPNSTVNEPPLLSIDQLVQSHTPMKHLVGIYKTVLVVGGEDPLARDVAESYGFSNVVRPLDIVRQTPDVWPFTRYTTRELTEYAKPLSSDLKIDAVLVFNDPRDMGTDLQIVLDILCSQGGIPGTRRNVGIGETPAVPIIFSNMDLLWSTGYPVPRFGQGAFRNCVRELYANLNDGAQLKDTVLGKPWPVSYKYAEWVLGKEWKRMNGLTSDTSDGAPALDVKPVHQLFEKVYMVGDNPESDIKGGNDYGWETILVQTGVYKDGDFKRNSKLARPTFGTFDNVWEGVQAALMANGIK